MKHRGAVQVHVDLDNLWIYSGIYAPWSAVDATVLYKQALPEMLTLFRRHAIKATFFVVGRDLDDVPESREALLAAVAEGHEIANHTYGHPLHLRRLSKSDRSNEIRRGHDAIIRHLGVGPVGFRGPGYHIDAAMLDELSGLGYLYDSSVLPGVSCALMGAAVRRLSGQSGVRFGRRRYLAATRRVTHIASAAGPGMLELPVATASWLRLPAHSTTSFQFGAAYASMTSTLADRSSLPAVFLLHGIDTLDTLLAGEMGDLLPTLRWDLQRRLAFLDQRFARFQGRAAQTSAELITSDQLVARPSRLLPTITWPSPARS